jgi:hypothetical protein
MEMTAIFPAPPVRFWDESPPPLALSARTPDPEAPLTKLNGVRFHTES